MSFKYELQHTGKPGGGVYKRLSRHHTLKAAVTRWEREDTETWNNCYIIKRLSDGKFIFPKDAWWTITGKDPDTFDLWFNL